MTTETIHTCSYECERPGCVRRQRDELRDRLEAELAQQPAAPRWAVNVAGMPEFDDLLDHIYEHGTTAEGVIERANAFARAVLAQYAPQQPAAVDEADTLLRDLVEALDAAFISSRQSTAAWQKQLDAAREYLAAQHQEPKS